MEPRLPDFRTGEDIPVISRQARTLGWCLWVGVPVAMGAAGIAFVLTGWSAAVLVILLPFAVGMLAIGLWGRSQPAITGWDRPGIQITCRSGSETVRWDDIEWFWKLWPTQRLDGSGQAWIATLVKYRTGGSSRKALFTVAASGPADLGGVLPGRYETVFDRQVPERNRARRT